MQTPSTAFSQAILHKHVQPIWLVEVAPHDQNFTSAACTLTSPHLAGQGLIAGSDVTAGSSRAAYAQRLAPLGQGIGRLSVAMDPLTSQVRVGDVQVEILNQSNYAQRLYNTAHWDNAVVRVLLGFAGCQYTDFLPVFWGVVDNSEITWDGLRLDVIDDSLRQHKDLSVPLSAQDFPNAPRANRGKAVPICIGRSTDVEAIQITTQARGTIATALNSGSTSVLLTEFDAPFPTTGTILLGSESGVTFASKTVVTEEGVSYLRLGDLVRAAPNNQAAGLAVVQSGLTYEYLVGYEVGEVTAVRVDDVLQTSGYSVTLADTGADKPVTTVSFTSNPGADAVITVDADGVNVNAEAGFTNGGFEAGATTGWTAGAGASGTVSSGSVMFGTYKLELAGADGVFKDFYQEFATVPGRYYTIELYYKDNVDGTNRVSNGSFESGTTSWTSTSISGNTAASATSLLALDGSKSLLMDRTVPPRDAQQWHHQLTQDFTTTSGSTYALTFAVYHDIQAAGHGAQGQIASYHLQTVSALVGTSTNPAQSLTQAGLMPGTTNGRFRGWKTYGPYSFTAPSTTTRLTLRGYSTAAGFPYGLTYPLYFDAVQVLQTSNLPHSTSGYKVGSSADDDLYASATLDVQYGWTRVEVTFQAQTSLSRLTLQSQWTGSAVHSHFDGVRLLDGGRNPSDAIAYVIDTYLPDMRRDTVSFATAYEQLKGWQFGAYLPDPGPSRDLLERMAFQCKSRLITSAAGKTTMVVFDTDAQSQLTLSTLSIAENSLRIRREPLDALYSEFYVYWGLRSGQSPESAESYQGVVSATPEATSHPTRALQLQCEDALVTLRRARRWDVMADMIRDRDTAHRLLEFLVDRHTRRQDLVELRTTYAAAPLEVGDLVTVIHPLLAAYDPTTCEVLAWGLEPGGAEFPVSLTLRTLRFGGIHEDWEWPFDTLVDVDITTESWES
jgi:hypothetical protein